jgi:hypothetical protein
VFDFSWDKKLYFLPAIFPVGHDCLKAAKFGKAVVAGQIRKREVWTMCNDVDSTPLISTV